MEETNTENKQNLPAVVVAEELTATADALEHLSENEEQVADALVAGL